MSRTIYSTFSISHLTFSISVCLLPGSITLFLTARSNLVCILPLSRSPHFAQCYPSPSTSHSVTSVLLHLRLFFAVGISPIIHSLFINLSHFYHLTTKSFVEFFHTSHPICRSIHVFSIPLFLTFHFMLKAGQYCSIAPIYVILLAYPIFVCAPTRYTIYSKAIQFLFSILV